MATQNNLSKTKEQVSKVFDQARKSLHVLRTLEKETLEKARTFVRIPSAAERKQLTQERILASLKKLGVATQSEVDALQVKVKHLEEELGKRSEPKRRPVSKGKK